MTRRAEQRRRRRMERRRPEMRETFATNGWPLAAANTSNLMMRSVMMMVNPKLTTTTKFRIT